MADLERLILANAVEAQSQAGAQLRDLDVAPAIQRALELGKLVAVAGQVAQVNRSAGEWGGSQTTG